MAMYHVTYQDRKKIIDLPEPYSSDELRKHILDTFGLNQNVTLRIQLYNKTFEDWVDIDIEDEQLSHGGKLNVHCERASAPAELAPGPSSAGTNTPAKGLCEVECQKTATPPRSCTSSGPVSTTR